MPHSLITRANAALRSGIASYRQLPPTTMLVIGLVLAIELVSLIFSGLPESACLSARGYLASPLLGIVRLFSNHFVHVGVLHVILNSLTWPVFAVPAETALGTAQFAHVVLVLAAVDSALYVILGLFLGLFVDGFGTACSAGLSTLIFSFLTIEACQSRGIFETLHIGTFQIPGPAFPAIIFGISSMIFPTASFVGHLSGLLGGYLFAFKILDRLLLPARILNTLENGRLFAQVSRWQTFVPHPAALSLPTHSRDLPGSSNFSLSNPFGRPISARYAPVNNPIGGGGATSEIGTEDASSNNGDNDPLMWDEDEIIVEGNAHGPADTLIDVPEDDDEDDGGAGDGGGENTDAADLLGAQKA
ncbi:hypothetical protein HDU87_006255 [Geranomyces variabilis]|uniref:rhomboid protease n=1 Tax=Geranomyces variabilis TaxID=109894 RepID=A0AAD5TI62_9FUNG|nr:hypothetical protein HDU87_006255 [Geranomyces variabilis]